MVVDLKTVMSWNPCEDFPESRIADIFEGRESCDLEDVFAEPMRQDEWLWVALREAFFSQHDLETLAAHFCLHVGMLANHEDSTVTNAVLNAILACSGSFDMLPEDKRHDRWASGATDAEKSVALSALWAATARANTEDDKEKRLEQWNLERDWQVSHVKKKAGIDATTDT